MDPVLENVLVELLVDLPTDADVPVVANAPERTWLWSDLHLSDPSVLLGSGRPFGSVEEMNRHLLRNWRRRVGAGDTVICLGDVAHPEAWRDDCLVLDLAECPGDRLLVLGNHDFTRFRWRERPLGVDASVMTLVIHADPPLLVTHVPLVAVPDGCVNVHGHHHDFRPPGNRPVDQRERRADPLPGPRCPHSDLAARQSARRRTRARGRDDDRSHPSSGLRALTGMLTSGRVLVGPGGAPGASSNVGRGVVVTSSGHRAR